MLKKLLLVLWSLHELRDTMPRNLWSHWTFDATCNDHNCLITTFPLHKLHLIMHFKIWQALGSHRQRFFEQIDSRSLCTSHPSIIWRFLRLKKRKNAFDSDGTRDILCVKQVSLLDREMITIAQCLQHLNPQSILTTTNHGMKWFSLWWQLSN